MAPVWMAGPLLKELRQIVQFTEAAMNRSYPSPERVVATGISRFLRFALHHVADRTWLGLIILSFFITGAAFPQDLTIDTNTTWEPGVYTYDNVIITNNATLIFNGAVTLNANNLTIDTGASISADGKGFGPETGPGHP